MPQMEHELTREIMFVYVMGMLARYKVQHWNQLLEGRKEDIIWTVEEYLTSTQTMFPNLIYNQLHGEQRYFYLVIPELFEHPFVKTQQIHWSV